MCAVFLWRCAVSAEAQTWSGWMDARVLTDAQMAELAATSDEPPIPAEAASPRVNIANPFDRIEHVVRHVARLEFGVRREVAALIVAQIAAPRVGQEWIGTAAGFVLAHHVGLSAPEAAKRLAARLAPWMDGRWGHEARADGGFVNVRWV